ncbi:CinA family protein [Hominifimenecus sp. rT4P-3]|uniref:CinA family protein n=1 Tax=Hominifimenecus sp. rT4P-3 TaxID=3242979 RepID=UPI003DA69389
MKCREEMLVELLKERNFHVTTAESCTGGLIAATIINVSGASAVLDQGLVTYSNEAKERLVCVQRKTLEAYGAVSPETAEEMARGAAASAGAEVGISSTGIAGPDGGTREKPVGLVYLGCFVQGNVKVKKCMFSGNRGEIRRQSVEAALDFALDCLKQEKEKSD